MHSDDEASVPEVVSILSPTQAMKLNPFPVVSHWQDLAKAKSSYLNFHKGVPHGCITLYIVGNVKFQNSFLASPSDMEPRTDAPLYISQLAAPDFSPSLKMETGPSQPEIKQF